MHILVVGAGAIGGYFGGRLLEAGRNVTFLVRSRRTAELAEFGLVIRSSLGDAEMPAPPAVVGSALHEPVDLVLLSCKAYDLDGVMNSMAPAVGANTAILPLLNGMRHLDILSSRFGAERVLGGQCRISTALDPDGRVLHLNDMHSLSFGKRHGCVSARVQAIAAELSGAQFDARLSETILQEMWEKWIFIATGAGITCLMRAAIGNIVAADGADLACALLNECAEIAAVQGFALSEAAIQRDQAVFTATGSALTASMLRDIERGRQLRRTILLGNYCGGASAEKSLLHIAYAHLKAYEARRARIQAAG